MNLHELILSQPDLLAFGSRFYRKVRRRAEDQCWFWTGSKHRFGYGFIGVRGKVVTAHRVAWTLANGPIPEGLHILHSCDNPDCCNPAHLRAGTNADNVSDMVARKRQTRGSKHPMAKLTGPMARAIVKDARPFKVIANEYGITAETVSAVKCGEVWGHVTRASRERAVRGYAMAVLNWAVVEDIRTRRLSSGEFAVLYGVSIRTVQDVLNGTSWARF